MKKKIILVSLLAVITFTILIVLSSAGRNNSGSALYEVIILKSDFDTRIDLNSDKDGYIGNLYAKQDNKIKLTEGEHNITLTAQDYEKYSLKLSVPKDKELSIKLVKPSAETVLKEAMPSPDKYSYSKAKLFNNDTWLVSLISSASGEGETEIMITKKVGEKWETVEQGSYIDIDSLANANASSELIEYVKELQ